MKNAEDILHSVLGLKSFWRQEERREVEPENPSGPEPSLDSSECPSERYRKMKALQEKVMSLVCSDYHSQPVTQMPAWAPGKTGALGVHASLVDTC